MSFYILVIVFLLNCFLILDENHLLFNSFLNNNLDINLINSYQERFYESSLTKFKDQFDMLIGCEEYKENVSLISKLSEGVVKEVWLAKWGSFGYIAVSFLKNFIFLNDFKHNIYMLSNFSNFNSKFTSEYLGHCDFRILFTKFYRLGPLSNLYFVLKERFLIGRSSIESKDCFQFCIKYAKVIDYLHNSPIGIRVMCDSNDLNKLTSQFLIDDNLNIIANDLDALPDASNQQIKCGNRSLIGDLIAPEQSNSSSFYNQQIDIYKLPFVCNYILSLCPKNELLELLISRIHNKCFDKIPSKRPNSTEIVSEYLKINYTFFY